MLESFYWSVVGNHLHVCGVKAWSYAVGVARKHVSNLQSLVLKAVSGSDGVFRSRAGGTISCDAKMLLRQLVRLEDAWNRYGDVLKPVGFKNRDVIVPDYFGRDFRIPLGAMCVGSPSLKYYNHHYSKYVFVWIWAISISLGRLVCFKCLG